MQNKTNIGILPWIMWLLAAGFYCYEFFLQVSPSVMVKELMQSFGVNATAIGVLASLYFYAYAAMQIPAGVMLDRFGGRRLLTAAALTCAIGALLFGATSYFSITACGRLLIGFGSSFAAIGCMHTAATWLPKNRFSLLTGLMVTIGMMGAINGQAPLALVVDKLAWRPTMLVLSAIGLIVAILIWIIVRDRPKQHDDYEQSKRTLLHGLKHILRKKETWVCACYAGLMFTPTLVFGSLWGVPFIKTKYLLDTPAAAALVSMLYVGWVCGAPLIGALSDGIKQRKIFMYLGSLLALICLSAIIYLPPFSHIELGIVLFFFGVGSSSLILGFSIMRETNPHEDVGAAIGFMNCLNMLGGALMPPIIGLILDSSHSNKVLAAKHIYSTASFEIGLSSLTLAVLIAFILVFKIKETHAKSRY